MEGTRMTSFAAPAARPDKRIRVAHVGTGVTGIEALKGIINHPELDLVSLWVTSPDKVGVDAGVLARVPAVGISAVASLESALAAQPDILCYCGNGIGREKDAVEDISAALGQGVDVATISLLPMLYPQAGPAELRDPLAQAASAGKSTFLSTGIDPGFSSDVLPLALLTMSDEIEHIRMQEIGIYDHYDVEPVIRHVMGFGQPPSYQAPITSGVFVDYWGGLVRQVADRLGVALDDIVGTSDYAVHDRDLHTSVGLMEAGTVVARRVACDGRVQGTSVITAEHVTRMSAEVAPDWPRFDGVGESNYRVTITGNPNMRCDLDLGKRGDVWGSVSATAMRLVNLIPSVVAASPGLVSALDLPLVPGRRVVTAAKG
jgi:2,4-diaminopentanoate dehydrogenase